MSRLLAEDPRPSYWGSEVLALPDIRGRSFPRCWFSAECRGYFQCRRRDGTRRSRPAKVERGRYVISISGCNDCHTSGFAQTAGNVPESKWLSGNSLDWKGTWGTTCPANLRRLLASLSEEQWIHFVRNLQSRLPMP